MFNFLLASSGAIALLVYLVIACSQLVMRKRMESRGEQPSYKMWLFPGLTWCVIVVIVGILCSMLFMPAHRIEIMATGILALLVVLAGMVLNYRQRSGQPLPEGQRSGI